MSSGRRINRRFSLDSCGYYPDISSKSTNSILRRSSDSRSFQNHEKLHPDSSVLHKSIRSMMLEDEGSDRHDGSVLHNNQNRIFHRLFPEIPDTEVLGHVFTCALQKEVIYHGKMYVTGQHVCFYSSVLLKETKITIHFLNIKMVKKKNTAKIVPNAISVVTNEGHKFLFVSLLNREACYRLLQSLSVQSTNSSSPSRTEDWPDLDMDMSSPEESLENLQLSLTEETEGSKIRVHEGPAQPEEPSSFHTFLLFFLLLFCCCLLSSCYIGLRVVALEKQLGSMIESEET